MGQWGGNAMTWWWGGRQKSNHVGNTQRSRGKNITCLGNWCVSNSENKEAKLQKHLQEEVQIMKGLMNHMRKWGLYPDSNGKLLKFYMREICSLKITWVLTRRMTGWMVAAQRLLQSAKWHRNVADFMPGNQERKRQIHWRNTGEE